MAKSLRPSRIKLSDELQREIEEHAYSELAFEVGGMLFGKATSRTTEITGFVPALKAEKDQVSLTFTHEVWEEILKQGEEKFPGDSIVGWYHTHPSFGIFLSDYDAFIQQNFFSGKGQIALVVDPIAGSMGWFDLDSKGSVRRIAIEETKSGARQRPEASRPSGSVPKKGRLGSLVLTGLVSAALGGLLGFGFASGSAPADLSSALENREQVIATLGSSLSSAEQRIGELEARSQDLISTEGFVFTAQSEVLVSEVIIQIYADPGAFSAVQNLNPGISPETLLAPGESIFLPSKPWIPSYDPLSMLIPATSSGTVDLPSTSSAPASSDDS